jgi:hypothetical protein
VFALSPEGRARARAAGRHVDAAVEALAIAEVDLEELARVLAGLHEALRRP